MCVCVCVVCGNITIIYCNNISIGISLTNIIQFVCVQCCSDLMCINIIYRYYKSYIVFLEGGSGPVTVTMNFKRFIYDPHKKMYQN